MRELPDIKLNLIEGYSDCLATGYDGLVETFKMKIPPTLEDRLSMAKLKANELSNGGKEKLSIMFGGLDMQISGQGGKGGVSWWLSCPDFHIMIRRGGKEWNVSVKYEAVGMWCKGVDNIRDKARKALFKELSINCTAKEEKNVEAWIEDESNWVSVSRADFAFDLFSPEFSEEMVPEILNYVLCNSRSKKNIEFKQGAVGRSCYLETITIGKINNLQLQIYDKGKEIREKSGKEWMIKLWKREGFKPDDEEKIEHVWRLEVRMGKDFLKNRGALTFEQLEKKLPQLIAEALFTRRIVSPPKNNDNNMGRWALHPLWSNAYSQSMGATYMAPLGYVASGSRAEKQEVIKKAMAGMMRSHAVLEDDDGEYHWENAHNASIDLSLKAENDPKHEQKVKLAQERYKNCGKAQ